MTDINHETGELAPNRSRFTLWVAFLVFSTITMGSAVGLDKTLKESNSNSVYAIAASATTFALTAIEVVAHFIPLAATILVGTKIEGILIFILSIFWGAIVAVVTNAESGLSVDGTAANQVQNGNLYYFSWAGFVCSIVLLVSYLREAFGVDVVSEVQNRASRLSLWSGMLAAALVVMGSTSRILSQDCSGIESTLCTRTKFGVSLGTLGIVFSLLVICAKLCTVAMSLPMELGAAGFLAILNAFGVSFITSPQGPGAAIGNLYYFSWISFICSSVLVADCYNQFSGGGVSDSKNSGSRDTEVEVVETLEDQL